MTAFSKSFFNRSRYICLLLFLFYYRIGFAQQSVKDVSYHPYSLPAGLSGVPHISAANGTLHIVAVMVDFRTDNNSYTSGNGHFNTSIIDTSSAHHFIPTNVTIDPLPHDTAYFAAHLEFAKNYFEKVSGGKLHIQYTILPEIVHLDHPMSDYAPMGNNDSQDYKLADLVKDTWNTVQQNGGFDTTNLNPDNTVFIIFHAGSGRDFNFLGTALDHTPQDIPSILFKQKCPRKFT